MSSSPAIVRFPRVLLARPPVPFSPNFKIVCLGYLAVCMYHASSNDVLSQVGGGTKTRRPIALRMQYNPDCDQPRCYLALEDGREDPRSLQEIQVSSTLSYRKGRSDGNRLFIFVFSLSFFLLFFALVCWWSRRAPPLRLHRVAGYILNFPKQLRWSNTLSTGNPV